MHAGSLFQELLGLGIDIPGMASKGTLDREDDQPQGMSSGLRRGNVSSQSSIAESSSPAPGFPPAKLRQTLLLRHEENEEMEAMSQGSEVLNESVISSITDR